MKKGNRQISGLLCLVVLVFLLSVSCVSTLDSAQSAYGRGDYLHATALALQALDEEPGSSEVASLLRSIWNDANDLWRQEIGRFSSVEDIWEQEMALDSYSRLIQLHTMVQNVGVSIVQAQPDVLTAQGMQLQRELADKHVSAGRLLMSGQMREESAKALRHFRRAQILVPDYPMIEQSIARATELGMARVFIFTGPDTHIELNGTTLIPVLEQELGKLDGVEVVTVPNRYAAPIDDNHGADDFARGHRANLMLHVEPSTTFTTAVNKTPQSLRSIDWTREALELQISAETQLRYVLIDLQKDRVIKEGRFTVSDSDNGGFTVSAILHNGGSKRVDFGGNAGSRSVRINKVPPGVGSYQLPTQLSYNDRLAIPSFASSQSLGISPATYGTGERIDPSRYGHPSELANITDLRNHTFWLFDAIEYNEYQDGRLSYQTVYGQYMGEGVKASLDTATYERELYNSILSWMNSRQVRQTMRDRFLPAFYTQTVPRKIAQEVASLF